MDELGVEVIRFGHGRIPGTRKMTVTTARAGNTLPIAILIGAQTSRETYFFSLALSLLIDQTHLSPSSAKNAQVFGSSDQGLDETWCKTSLQRTKQDRSKRSMRDYGQGNSYVTINS